jgi:hypothetical protein
MQDIENGTHGQEIGCVTFLTSFFSFFVTIWEKKKNFLCASFIFASSFGHCLPSEEFA